MGDCRAADYLAGRDRHATGIDSRSWNPAPFRPLLPSNSGNDRAFGLIRTLAIKVFPRKSRLHHWSGTGSGRGCAPAERSRKCLCPESRTRSRLSARRRSLDSAVCDAARPGFPGLPSGFGRRSGAGIGTDAGSGTPTARERNQGATRPLHAVPKSRYLPHLGESLENFSERDRK